MAGGCYSGSVRLPAASSSRVAVGAELREGPRCQGRDKGGTGALVAYNAATGEPLCQAKTDAGANAPAMTYAVNGKQYVAILAGGTRSTRPKSHGDSVYAYALP